MRKSEPLREMKLDEMLDDPVVQAVMARDKVKRAEILDLVRSVRARLHAAAQPLAA